MASPASAPAALTDLPDDLLFKVMRFLNLEQKVKHSRICQRMRVITDHLLKKEKKLPANLLTRRFKLLTWLDTDLLYGQLKWLNRLPNLQQFHVPPVAGDHLFFGFQLADACPAIRSIKTINLTIVHDYAFRLQQTGQMIPLELIEWISDDAFEADILIRILSLRQGIRFSASSEAIVNTIRKYSAFLTSDPVCRSLIHGRLDGFRVTCPAHARYFNFSLFAGVRVLDMSSHMDDQIIVPILSSLPLVQDLRIKTELRNFRHINPIIEKLGINLTKLKLTDNSFITGRPHGHLAAGVDTGPFVTFLKQHASHLTHLQVSCPTFCYVSRQEGHLLEILNHKCPRLTDVNITNLNYTELVYNGLKKSLAIDSWRERSLALLFQTFPGVRSFEIMSTSFEMYDWSGELQRYTGQKRNAKFKAKIWVRRSSQREMCRKIRTGNLFLRIRY